jgi:hypothetical protein
MGLSLGQRIGDFLLDYCSPKVGGLSLRFAFILSFINDLSTLHRIRFLTCNQIPNLAVSQHVVEPHGGRPPRSNLIPLVKIDFQPPTSLN